ncbi:MAG: alpha-glucosidase [Bacteroidota bacterium]
MKNQWWKESVIYQIYPRSFKDSNGDGVGDLNGIIQKVPYLSNLGIDILWLSPIYQSPNDDNGYDISDYYRIMTEFGDMAQFDELLALLHQHKIRLVMDLVVNHTSDEHQWFQQARQSKDNPFHDYYIWQEALQGQLPNNWKSFFSGPAWEWNEATQEYYLHLFTRRQADLNWENPAVRQEVYKMMRFWLDKGIDGFRMDVISLISKDLSFADKDWQAVAGDPGAAYANGPRVHEFLQEMHREVLQHYDIMTIGEGPGIGLEHANDYVGADRHELNMVFHFGHMFIDFSEEGRFIPMKWSRRDFFRIFEEWDQALGERGWNSLYLGNHDFPRMLSRWGNDTTYRKESAKLLATLLFTLRGTPGIYQGDEIGMTNTPFQKIEDFRDVDTLNHYRDWVAAGKDPETFVRTAAWVGRDHARTPVLWDASPNGGFTEGEPWIMANPNYPEINVEAAEADPDSILHYYRKLIRYRKEHKTLVYGETEVLRDAADTAIYAFRRWDKQAEFLTVLNFGNDPISSDLAFPAGAPALTNYPNISQTNLLSPWEARVYQIR